MNGRMIRTIQDDDGDHRHPEERSGPAGRVGHGEYDGEHEYQHLHEDAPYYARRQVTSAKI